MAEHKVTVYSLSKWLRITLQLVKHLLAVAGVCLGIGAVVAGGDGRYSDGDPLLMLELFGLLILTVIAWHAVDALRNYRYREIITTMQVVTDYGKIQKVTTRRTERIHHTEKPYVKQIKQHFVTARSQEIFTDMRQAVNQ